MRVGYICLVVSRKITTSKAASPETVEAAKSSIGPTPIVTLYRGRLRLELIRELAMGEWSVASIARRIGVDVSDVTDFEEEYRSDIAEVRQALAGQLAIEAAGLWISKKHNRIAELQADFDELNDVLKEMRSGTYKPTDNDGTNLGSRRHRGILKSKMDILKAVSEELSPRSSSSNAGSPDDPNVVRYVIDAGEIAESLR